MRTIAHDKIQRSFFQCVWLKNLYMVSFPPPNVLWLRSGVTFDSVGDVVDVLAVELNDRRHFLSRSFSKLTVRSSICSLIEKVVLSTFSLPSSFSH